MGKDNSLKTTDVDSSMDGLVEEYRNLSEKCEVVLNKIKRRKSSKSRKNGKQKT